MSLVLYVRLPLILAAKLVGLFPHHCIKEKKKKKKEGLLHSNCLPAINDNSQSFTNFLLMYKKENAPLPLYSDL